MNFIFQIIPFLIIFIIIYTITKSSSSKVLFKTGRTSKLIIVSYIVFLTVGVLIAYLLPNSNVAKELEIDLKQVELISQNFHDIASSSELASTAGIYETDKWSFEYHEEQLTVLENGDYWIVYEKKAESDGQIDIARYMTKYVYRGFDYTDAVDAPTVELSGNHLTITEPPLVDIRLADFHKEFTITQFTGESMFNDHARIWGTDAVVIRVPANVEVVRNQSDSVYYINE